MFDEYCPVADAAPSSVKPSLSPRVGSPVLFQLTPCAVGFGAPRSVIWPLPLAVVGAMSSTARVSTSGGCGSVLKDTWFPYDVPAVLVA